MKNNQKSFAKIVLIGAAVVLIALSSYLAWSKKSDQSQFSQANLEVNSTSSAYIYGPELNKVKVYLYAPDEKTSIVADNYCGGSKGSKVRSGNYKLVIDSTTATSDNPGGNSDLTWNSSSLDIGSVEFVQGTAFDGKITVDQFDSNGYSNFIVLQKYGGCNGNIMQVYGYDVSQGKLVEYTFLQGNAHADVMDNLFVTNFKKSASGNLLTSTYDQTVGRTLNTEWTVDNTNYRFEPKQISYDDVTTNWKTYRNDKYGFEFQHPSGWVSGENSEGVIFGPDSNDAGPSDYFRLDIIDQKTLESHEKNYDSVINWHPELKGDPNLLTKTTLVIGGVNAIKYYRPNIPYQGDIYLLNKGTGYHISYSLPSEFSKLDHIISTFKFTK